MTIIKNDTGEVVYYSHIPKSAGTSLQLALQKGYELCFIAPQHKYMKITPQHIDINHIKYFNIEGFIDKSFTITRHPMDRIISEFKYRSNSRSTLLRNILDFDSFVYYFLNEYKSNPEVLGNHITPQTKFILNNTKVFRLEDGMDNIVNTLNTEFGFSKLAMVGNSNVSEPKEISMTKKTKKMIEIFYASDYEQFNYKTNKVKIKHKLGISVMLRAFIYKLASKLAQIGK